MQALYQFKRFLKQSLWFLPLLVISCIALLFAITISLDSHQALTKTPLIAFFYQLDVDATRALIGKLAAAIMTMAGIVFSLVFVALSLASGQFGPRLLQHFIRDNITQLTLGVFIGTFVFHSLTFVALGDNLPFDSVPGFTVAVAIFIALASLIFLLYFIHNLASGMQADIVVDNIYLALKRNLLAITSPSESELQQQEQQFASAIKNAKKISIKAEESGYLQAIDKSLLTSYCQKHLLYFDCLAAPGDYLIKGDIIAYLYFNENEHKPGEHKITQYITLGGMRTPFQDLEFEIHQITEIAIRSLSKGINDPYTAKTCVDKLSEIAVLAIRHGLPSPYTQDTNETPRIKLPALSIKTILSDIFDQLIRHAQDDYEVTINIVNGLKRINEEGKSREVSDAVGVLLADLLAIQNATSNNPRDQERLEKLVAQITTK